MKRKYFEPKPIIYCKYCGVILFKYYVCDDCKQMNKRKKASKYNALNKLKTHDINYYFKRYESSANRRKISFDLSLDEFEIVFGKACSYCGIVKPTNGIDRVNSKLPYHKDNVVPCCSRCNSMKMDMQINDFIDHILAIHNHITKLTE